eukprot:scaffold3055_cov402-Prasinococcus_capsulatus_cf.AAC.8
MRSNRHANSQRPMSSSSYEICANHSGCAHLLQCVQLTSWVPELPLHEGFDVAKPDGVGWHKDVLARPIAGTISTATARVQALAPLSDQHGSLKHHVRLRGRGVAEG